MARSRVAGGAAGVAKGDVHERCHRTERQGWPVNEPDWGQMPQASPAGLGTRSPVQAHLDLKLHLLLNTDHLLRAAHFPDTLIARFHHLA